MVTYSEKWCDILGYKFPYSISNYGRVRRQPANHTVLDGLLLAPQYDSNGYIYVYLRKGHKQKCLIVHIAVAQAFIGPCPPGYVVDHVDGNPGNPKVDNLEYVTSSENVRRGRLRKGTLISDETRQMVIDLREEGYSYEKLALIADISPKSAWNIVHGTDRVAGGGVK